MGYSSIATVGKTGKDGPVGPAGPIGATPVLPDLTPYIAPVVQAAIGDLVDFVGVYQLST